ncbi:MAG: hypothetical protein LBG65_01035, partial [Puniceicoccales bacterium]|nr:hypothetical protein [Puniceicoccales bacterium]
MIPRQAVGQYLPKLKEIQSLHDEKKFFEFYEAAEKALKDLRSSEKSFYPRSAEGIAFLHWIGYYQASAPLFTFDALENRKQTTRRRTFVEDFFSKIAFCEYLCKEDASDVAKKFSLDRKVFLRHEIANLSSMFLFFKSVAAYVGDTEEHRIESEEIIKKEREKYQKNAHENERNRPRVIIISGSGNEADRRIRERQRRRLEMDSSFKEARINVRDKYIRKLVECFPRQGRIVQDHVHKGLCEDFRTAGKSAGIRDYLRKNPCPKDVDLTILLERAIPRNGDMEWVFAGLPPPGVARTLKAEWVAKYSKEVLRQDMERKLRAARESEKKKVVSGKFRTFVEACGGRGKVYCWFFCRLFCGSLWTGVDRP